MKKRIVITGWHRENLTNDKSCLLLLQKDLDNKSVCEDDLINKISKIINFHISANKRKIDTKKIAESIIFSITK